jgi:prepilin-type N-terminal cleavage/methylation domain-containing protein
MKRLSLSRRTPFSPSARRSSGFTLIEMLVATALTLILMGAVVRIFGAIGQTVSDSRSIVEATDRLRAAQIRLQKDLDGATASLMNEIGYLEVIEGPVGLTISPGDVAVDENGAPDLTVGDFDDVLVLTTHSGGASFSGLRDGNTIESDYAEVAWFVRGSNLYRREMLVAPGTTLADLARRDNRFVHGGQWPPAPGKIDFWNYGQQNPGDASEDVILTNVIGFDVKVWDIEARAYVDLGGQGSVSFANVDPRSGLTSAGGERVYDTWSLSYESDGIDQDADRVFDQASDGFDNNGTGGVDDTSERETSPPYAVPLRGIKVEIRMFEPTSRQVRLVTVVGEFLPK